MSYFETFHYAAQKLSAEGRRFRFVVASRHQKDQKKLEFSATAEKLETSGQPRAIEMAIARNLDDSPRQFVHL